MLSPQVGRLAPQCGALTLGPEQAVPRPFTFIQEMDTLLDQTRDSSTRSKRLVKVGLRSAYEVILPATV